MSIKAMTWAFGLPLEPRAKIALLAIADNARDDGVAWPSRDLIAEKSSQSRATINRRLKILSEIGVLGIHERYREDGSQTTDEIRLDLNLTPDDVQRRIDAMKPDDRAESESENDDEGGMLSDTPPMHSGSPGDSLEQPPGYHCGNPQDEPSLEPSPPPNPPPGAGGPLSKSDREANEKREVLWRKFVATYPGILAMDQDLAKLEFLKLALDHCDWAIGAAPAYAAECQKLKKPPKNAHIWLRKGMFKNLSPTGAAAAGKPGVYPANSPEANAIRVLHLVAGRSEAFFKIWRRADGSVNFPKAMTPQLAALAQAPDPAEWIELEPKGAGSWEDLLSKFFDDGVRRIRPRAGTKAPWPFAPSKEGKIYTTTGPPTQADGTLMSEDDYANI